MNESRKVYVVETYDYDSHTVEGVFSSEDAAATYAYKIKADAVCEYDLDVIDVPNASPRRAWTMRITKGEFGSASVVWYAPRFEFGTYQPVWDQVIIECWAESEDEAVALAGKRFKDWNAAGRPLHARSSFGWQEMAVPGKEAHP